MPRRWRAIMLAGTLALGACGGSAEPDSSVPDTTLASTQTTTTESETDTTEPEAQELPDPCLLLTDEEVGGLVGGSVSSVEDALGSQFVRQCSYSKDEGDFDGISLQVAAAGSLDEGLFGFESDDVDILDLDGIGEWAFAVINHENPAAGITASVQAVSAGSGTNAVNIFPFTGIFPDDARYQGLLDLLEAAVSGLPDG
ncbi:MAG: hypothetical protein ACFCU2_13135 [Acidimicrobiia bacterium]